MARAALTTKTLSRTATNLSAANKTTIALADGAEFTNTGKEFLYIESIHSSTVVVTIPIPKTVDGAAVASKTWTMAVTASAGDIILVGPFPTEVYNQASNKVYIDVAVDAVIKVIALQFTPTT